MYQYKQKHAKSFYEHQNNPKLCILLVTKLLTFMFGQALEINMQNKHSEHKKWKIKI